MENLYLLYVKYLHLIASVYFNFDKKYHKRIFFK